MFNKSKLLVLALASMATLGLVGCGQSSTTPVSSSVDDGIDVTQNSSVIPDVTEDISMVGSITDQSGATLSNWDQTAKTNPQFTKVSKMLYTLKNVSIAANSQFKFVANHAWTVQYNATGVCYKDATVKAKFEDTGDPDHNIKVVTAGVYDFEYHPFYVIEGDATLTAKIIIMDHVA